MNYIQMWCRLPEALTPSTIKNLLEEFKQDPYNTSIQNKLIEGHLRLAVSYAKRYSDDQDLAGEVFLAVSEAVRVAPEKLQDDNLTAYVISRIKSAIHVWLSRRPLVRVKRTKYQSSKEKIPILPLLNDPEVSDFDFLCFKECFSIIAVSDTEKQILQLALTGYSLTEIQGSLSISYYILQRHLNEMRKRFLTYHLQQPNITLRDVESFEQQLQERQVKSAITLRKAGVQVQEIKRRLKLHHNKIKELMDHGLLAKSGS